MLEKPKTLVSKYWFSTHAQSQSLATRTNLGVQQQPLMVGDRERREVGRGYQTWGECGSLTRVGCTHILPTFSVGKCRKYGAHDSSSSHPPLRHSSDLCASKTFQLTSTASTITPSPLGGRSGRSYDRASGGRWRWDSLGIVRVSDGWAPAVKGVGWGGVDVIGGGMVSADNGSLYGAK